MNQLWKAARYEQAARLTRTRPRLDHYDRDRRLRQKALKALERLRWIDDKLFPFGNTKTLKTGATVREIVDNAYETKPINAAIDKIERQDASEQDRELRQREVTGAATQGQPDELGRLGRVIGTLAREGEPVAALVRWYSENISNKGGFPAIPEDLLTDRLRKRKASKRK